jgi:hypothetical protein
MTCGRWNFFELVSCPISSGKYFGIASGAKAHLFAVSYVRAEALTHNTRMMQNFWEAIWCSDVTVFVGRGFSRDIRSEDRGASAPEGYKDN